MSNQAQIRVGVIGLGRLWEARHKPAFAKMRDRFQVTAVYDQVLRRAEIEARQLGCAAVEGLNALVNRSDVDAVYLLTPQWFGLHPVELACKAGKPVYCALPLAGLRSELELAAKLVEQSGIPFMPEFARRSYPATIRLRELLASTLGPPRLILGHSRLFGFDRYGSPGPATQLTPAPLMIDPGSYLLDWCNHLFQASLKAVQGSRSLILSESETTPPAEVDSDFESFIAEYEGGGMAQISLGRYHRKAWGEATKFLPPPGFQVYSERGLALVELPDRIQWSDVSGTHEERLALDPSLGEVLNDQFFRLIRENDTLAPTIGDALAVSRRIYDIQTSQREGARIVQ